MTWGVEPQVLSAEPLHGCIPDRWEGEIVELWERGGDRTN